MVDDREVEQAAMMRRVMQRMVKLERSGDLYLYSAASTAFVGAALSLSVEWDRSARRKLQNELEQIFDEARCAVAPHRR